VILPGACLLFFSSHLQIKGNRCGVPAKGDAYQVKKCSPASDYWSDKQNRVREWESHVPELCLRRDNSDGLSHVKDSAAQNPPQPSRRFLPLRQAQP